jgi:hypothetical protein
MYNSQEKASFYAKINQDQFPNISAIVLLIS